MYKKGCHMTRIVVQIFHYLKAWGPFDTALELDCFNLLLLRTCSDRIDSGILFNQGLENLIQRDLVICIYIESIA